MDFFLLIYGAPRLFHIFAVFSCSFFFFKKIVRFFLSRIDIIITNTKSYGAEWNNNGAIHYYSWVVSSIHWIFILLRTIFTSILHVRVIGSRNENHLICRYTLSANNVKTIETKIQKCQVSCTNLFDLLFWVQSDNAMKCERHKKKFPNAWICVWTAAKLLYHPTSVQNWCAILCTYTTA